MEALHLTFGNAGLHCGQSDSGNMGRDTAYINKVKVEGKQVHARLFADVLFILCGAGDDIDDEAATLQIDSNGSGQGRRRRPSKDDDLCSRATV